MKYFYTIHKLSENLHETPEGYLMCRGVPIARTGEMVYGADEVPLEPGPDGKVIISRDEKDVFNPKTMASFEGKPITITHPQEFVSPENWKELAKGIVQNVRRGDGDLKNDLIADLLIMDSIAIGLVKNGLREVSCGYEATYTQEDAGEGKQTRIIGNHVALVDQGRAGSSYAINDHKKRGVDKMTIKEKITSIFSKAKDEAIALVKDEAPEAKKEDKKDESKDEEHSKEDAYGNGLKMYDEIKDMYDALGEKIKLLGGAKDEEKKDDSKDEDEEKKDESKDDYEDGLENRLKALEAAVQKLLSKKDESKDEEEESEDEDEGEHAEDDDMEENTMPVGDAASRVEILAPGMESNVKDFKVEALKTAYKTKDGKKIIDALTNSKPDWKNKDKVDLLFVAASEALKQSRSSELAEGRKGSSTQDNAPKGPMTPEQMNEINAKHYANVKV